MRQQAKHILADAIELPLTAGQAELVADLLASQKRERKSYLFLALTDSLVPAAGRGCKRESCRTAFTQKSPNC